MRRLNWPGLRYRLTVTALVVCCGLPADGAQSQFFHSTAPPGSQSVLLRLRVWYSQGRFASPCAEDRRDRAPDTLFLRVHAGDAFMVGGRMGALYVADVHPIGAAKIELPESGRGHSHPGAEPEYLWITRVPAHAGTQFSHGNESIEFAVVDSLPHGATEGIRPLRNRWMAFQAQEPVILETVPPSVPMSYKGPWGTVRVLVTLDETGGVARASVEHGVSHVLDHVALRTARQYRYRLGVPCKGFEQIRSLKVDFPFKGWR